MKGFNTVESLSVEVKGSKVANFNVFVIDFVIGFVIGFVINFVVDFVVACVIDFWCTNLVKIFLLL